MFADMHTHTNHSKDSSCDLYDLYLSQIEKGTEIFAVTDHFDTSTYTLGNGFDSIKASFNAVCDLRERCDKNHTVLAGIELGEGFWNREVYEKIINLVQYDVIIGSIHKVSQKGFSDDYYISIDFSALSAEEITLFMNAYFNDIIKMIETVDFDILAHLTCPTRYLQCKHGISIDETQFFESIETILKMIIERSIALELNTPYLDRMGDFTPSCEILRLYRSLGGRLITLGSDCHAADGASKFFTQAAEQLKEIGFESIFYYQNRKPKEIKI